MEDSVTAGAVKDEAGGATGGRRRFQAKGVADLGAAAATALRRAELEEVIQGSFIAFV